MLENFIQNFNIQDVIIRVFVICISLSFHEMAHAWRAYKLGDDTAYHAGRLTMNPLAHLDPIGTLMMIFARVGWAKPVPINPVLFTRAKTMKRGIVEVSLAGPLSNLLLALVSYILYQTTWIINAMMFSSASEINPVISVIFSLFGALYISNIYLALFNLLPVPPLDGYKIFGSLLPNNIYYKLMDIERYIGIAFLAIVVFAGGIFSVILNALATPIRFIIETPINLIFDLIYNLVK